MPTNDENMYADLDLDSVLFRWLDEVQTELRTHWGEIHELRGPFGVHGVSYGNDAVHGERFPGDDCDFAVIGFCLPDGVYAETECETYGQLQGFRIYRSEDE